MSRRIKLYERFKKDTVVNTTLAIMGAHGRVKNNRGMTISRPIKEEKAGRIALALHKAQVPRMNRKSRW